MSLLDSSEKIFINFKFISNHLFQVIISTSVLQVVFLLEVLLIIIYISIYKNASECEIKKENKKTQNLSHSKLNNYWYYDQDQEGI